MPIATLSRDAEPRWVQSRPALLQGNLAAAKSLTAAEAIKFVAVKAEFQEVFKEFS